MPPCLSAAHDRERTYANLIGPLGAEPTVTAECVFVDPVADISVLGSPDGQEPMPPLPIGALTFVRKPVTTRTQPGACRASAGLALAKAVARPLSETGHER